MALSIWKEIPWRIVLLHFAAVLFKVLLELEKNWKVHS